MEDIASLRIPAWAGTLGCQLDLSGDKAWPSPLGKYAGAP